MKLRRETFDWATDRLLIVEEATPICGEDVCDTCGDCLACFPRDPCPSRSGQHRWIHYVGMPEDPAALGRDGA